MFSGDGLPGEVEELSGLGRSLAARVSVLHAELVRVVAALDAHESVLGMRTSSWVSWQFGLTVREAQELVELARALPALPRLTDALGSGALSVGITRLLASVATPGNEASMLEMAGAATGAQLQRLVGEHRRQLQRDDTTEPVPPPDPQFVASWERDRDGRAGQWRGRFRLDAIDGLVADEALHVARDLLDPTGPHGGPREHHATNADAFALICAQWLDSQLGAAADTTDPTLVPEHHQIHLHATLDTPDTPGPASAMAEGSHSRGWLDAATLTEAACAATLAVVVTRHGHPLATTRTRFATPEQRRHLLIRDRTCRYPGCGTTRHLIAHHAVAWPAGSTSPDNLVLLCRHHHRVVHRNQIAITIAPDGAHTFTLPGGTPIHRGTPRPAPPTNDPQRPARSIGLRYVGTGEPLTAWATSEIIDHWHRHRTSTHDRANGAHAPPRAA